MTTAATLGSGVRKYTPIWQKIKESGACDVQCSHKDTLSIINMVRKERTRDKTRPQGKIMEVEILEDKDGRCIGVRFKLVTDTSIRNL